jgi:hypothetical protein
MVGTEIAVFLVEMSCIVLVVHCHVRGSASSITLLIEAVDSFEMLTCGYQNVCHRATILVVHSCMYL